MSLLCDALLKIQYGPHFISSHSYSHSNSISVMRYTLLVIRYSLHEYTGIHNRNRRVAACIAQWCEYLNWVNGKLHTKVNTVQKQLTCLAPFASALSRFILSFCSASATQQLPAPFAIWKSGGWGGGRHCCTAHTSCAIQCIISLPLLLQLKNVWEHKWKDIWYMQQPRQRQRQQQRSRCQLIQVAL